jgi:hypothetical protein
LAGVVPVIKGIRKGFKNCPSEILVNLPVDLALTLNLREIGIEAGHEPIAQALAALLIIPLGRVRYIVGDLRKKNQPVHQRIFRIFS